MNNSAFLNCIFRSFKKFLETSSRSNQKLKVLHGAIAADLAVKLGQDYTIKSLGFLKGKEGKIQGRYINKSVDITILKENIEIAGIAIKFVMQNYSQNSNNYFENMLGETVNIRANNIPYFQILIIPDEIPYYKKDKGEIQKWENFTLHNVDKYRTLSEDLVENSIQTPIKTLLYVIKLPTIDNKSEVVSRGTYKNHYLSLPDFEVLATETNFGAFSANVIFNDYEEFIRKTVYRILSV